MFQFFVPFRKLSSAEKVHIRAFADLSAMHDIRTALMTLFDQFSSNESFLLVAVDIIG